MWVFFDGYSGGSWTVRVYSDDFATSESTTLLGASTTWDWHEVFTGAARGDNLASNSIHIYGMSEYPYSLARGIVGVVEFWLGPNYSTDRKYKLFYIPFYSDGTLDIGSIVRSDNFDDNFDYAARYLDGWNTFMVISPSQSMTTAGLNALTGVALVDNKPYKLTNGLANYPASIEPDDPNWITMAGMPDDEEYYCLGAYGNYLLAARKGPASYDPQTVNNLAGSVIARTFTGADIAAGLKNEAPPVNSGQIGPRPSQNSPNRIFHDGNRLYVNDRGGDADEFGDISWSLTTV